MKNKYEKNPKITKRKNKKSRKLLFYSASIVFCLLGIGFSLFVFCRGSQNCLNNLNETNVSSGTPCSSFDNDSFLHEKNNLNNNSKLKKLSKTEVLNHGFSEWNQLHPELRVINNRNSLPENFQVKTAILNTEVGEVLFEPLKKMFKAALDKGIEMHVVSGYRSIELQTKLFRDQFEYEMKNNKKITKKMARKVAEEIAREAATSVVARPGHSEHNAGLAVDINSVEGGFGNTSAYKWLKNHAHEYGFIERYTASNTDETGVIAEPWHWRYVGVDFANKIKNSGKTLERYIIENEILK